MVRAVAVLPVQSSGGADAAAVGSMHNNVAYSLPRAPAPLNATSAAAAASLCRRPCCGPSLRRRPPAFARASRCLSPRRTRSRSKRLQRHCARRYQLWSTASQVGSKEAVRFYLAARNGGDGGLLVHSCQPVVLALHWNHLPAAARPCLCALAQAASRSRVWPTSPGVTRKRWLAPSTEWSRSGRTQTLQTACWLPLKAAWAMPCRCLLAALAAATRACTQQQRGQQAQQARSSSSSSMHTSRHRPSGRSSGRPPARSSGRCSRRQRQQAARRPPSPASSALPGWLFALHVGAPAMRGLPASRCRQLSAS